VTYRIDHGDSLDFYDSWDAPTTIISDGAYGVGGFEGDPKTADNLAAWYRPHIEAWTKKATTATSLWFWNTELGWAVTHPVLAELGWVYVQTVTWDKGMAHAAGNVNGNTIRRFPTVTEVSSLYVRPTEITPNTGATVQDWLRAEWKRAGLTLDQANKACGVANAASRKYLTGDHLWYMPPYEAFAKMQAYANAHGTPTDKPYLVLPDGLDDEASWIRLRSIWNHAHGLTNVWQLPALRNDERIKVEGAGKKSLHSNQKPLELMRRQIAATTNPGDIVWEPFGGLMSASVAADELGRNSFAADVNAEFVEAGRSRLKNRLSLFD
jgi:site-specific DNA-methyltransferase (adenine-specific)